MPITNQGLPIQPLPIGQQGTATFRPNWGQPIVDSQWQGQPQTAPAIDPREVVGTNLKQLRADFKQRASTLRASGLDANVHNRILAGWQDEYDQAKTELTGTVSQLDLIQQSVEAGGMAPEAGREAGLRMIMPRETIDLMFPSVQAGDSLSIGQYRAHVGMAEEAGTRTIVDPWGFIRKEKRKHADRDKLVSEYHQYRAKIRYNAMSRDEKIQADLAFDEGMGANDRTATAWTKVMRTDPQIKALRTYDPGLMAVAAKKVLGEKASPLGKSIARKLPFMKKLQAASPIGAALLYRELAAKRRTANKAMPKPTTKGAYDKLPSGTQYIGTDGQMRTKR